MSDIKVVCTSDKNVSLTFTWDDFTPFHLVDIEGIYGIESNVVCLLYTSPSPRD